MTETRVSADGYPAGHNQTGARPFGDGDTSMLHAWMYDTPEENRAELDAISNAGAFIVGRNMFGPIRDAWIGTEGDGGDPSRRTTPRVFVLTHHEREPLDMERGTTFCFVTDGVHAAFDEARAVAGEGNAAIAGGATTVDQYLAAGLVDELRLHIAPVKATWRRHADLDDVPPSRLEQASFRSSSVVTDVTYRIPR